MVARLSDQSLAWSLFERPELILAGRFPLLERDSGFVYRSSNVALHQHQYAGEVQIGRCCCELRPGDVTLTPAGVDSHYRLPRDGFHLCIHFRAAGRDGGGAPVRLPIHLRPGAGAEAIRQRIWWLTERHRRAADADPGKRALALAAASSGLQELLLSLALLENEPRPADGGVTRRVEQALLHLVDTIEARLSTVLAVPALAAQVGFSQNYLSRVFRRRYGMAVPRFILLRRIDLARHLLTTGGSPVKAVAHTVGLPDVQHFNKQFRRLTGQSPSAYRDGMREPK